MAGASKRFDVVSPREYESRGEKKTFWLRVGSAFTNEKGTVVYLDAVPVPTPEDNGRIKLMLFEPRSERGDDSGKKGDKGRGKSTSRSDMDDEIPF